VFAMVIPLTLAGIAAVSYYDKVVDVIQEFF
jgi:hypothetical protein